MEWKISTINEQQQLQWQQQKQQQQKWLHEFYLIFPKAVVGLIWNDFFLFWLCKFFILIILILFLVKTNSETKKYNSNMRWNFNNNWINQQKNQMFKLFHSFNQKFESFQVERIEVDSISLWTSIQYVSIKDKGNTLWACVCVNADKKA